MASGVDYCNIPLRDPPAGQTSNLIDPGDLSIETLALGPVLTVLSLVFLAGRFLNVKKFNAADYLAVTGFVLSTGYTGVIIALRKLSRHAWNVPTCWYLTSTVHKELFASNMLLGPTQFVVKVAMLVLYFQLFAIDRRTRWAIIAAIVFAGLIYLPHPILVIILEAPHIGQSWVEPAVDGRTSKLEYYAPIYGIGSIILDIWILVLPLPVITKLKVSRKKKIQLFAVFVTGFMGIISSIFSCVWRFRLLLSGPGDTTWQEAQLFLWTMVEHNVALMVGSMPAFAAFVQTHAAGSFHTLRYNLLKGRRSSGDLTRKGLPVTIANDPNDMARRKAHQPCRSYYHGLGNSLLQNTQTSVSVVDPIGHGTAPHAMEEEQGILKVVVFSQESHHSSAS
ncbi:hypothetical protein VPNG_10338 [Cytospora leucostoma]|uniref:Rhodopsin domain-containing protein n=1 Tax=Cytospora leucostoma TaxID=1230097 RepID=A0A423VAT0_9PEZI|nr:hypothetical protein VPNG_10338 [Cytospora leucostoma]